MTESEALTLKKAECELAVYRKGFLCVKFDFVRNVLIWKDSNRWYNNFVRGLPESGMRPVHDAFLAFLKECRDLAPDDSDEPHHYLWRVNLDDGGNSIEITGSDIENESWRNLVQAVEKAGKRNFRL